MFFFLTLAQLSVLLTFVKSDLSSFNDYNVNNDGLSYRLQNDIDVTNVELEVTPYLLSSPTPEQLFTFDGIATLEIRVRRDNLTALILHENLKDIISVELSADGTPVLLNETYDYERIEQFNLLRINLREGETLNRSLTYQLRVTYTGHIHKSPLKRGLYAGTYKDPTGNQQWYISTHLHPTHARELLPCLDEPGYKSTFDITVVRHNQFTNALSNMNSRVTTIPSVNYTREVFYRTPRMSAYQIGIHLSTEFVVLADNEDDTRPFRVIGRPNNVNLTSYAMRVGPLVTSWLESYLGIGYYTMAEGVKSDHIAIPELASDLTENWGLNSYRENLLLLDEEEADVIDRSNAAIAIARGIAHKWFGNYVTAEWWQDSWLNDGLATFFAYFANIADSSLRLSDRFNVEVLHSVMEAHQTEFGVTPVRNNVNTPDEISAHLAGPGHLKAAALLHMIRNSMREPDFRRALTNYLTERSLNSADSYWLFHALNLAASPDGVIHIPFGRGVLLDIWMQYTGYPYVFANVDLADGLIRLRQERFIESRTSSTSRWPLLVDYFSGIDNNPSVLHETQGQAIQVPRNTTWYVLNHAQRGFYRVDYNRANWQRIASALKERPTPIHRLNVAQIVDDIFNFMRQPGPPWRMIPMDGFEYLDFLKETSSYYAWYPAINGFTWMRNRLLHLPSDLQQFDESVLRYMAFAIQQNGYEFQVHEPIETTIIRMKMLSFACKLGHSGCVADAVSRFRAFRDNPSKNTVNPNLRRHVFCEGVRAGDHDDFEFLYQRYSSSNNQAYQLVTLQALGCTSNATNINRLLDMITYNSTSTDDLTPTPVLPQNRLEAFTWLYEGNRGSAKVALEYLKGNVERVRRALVLSSAFTGFLSKTAAHLDGEGLLDMESWLRNSETQIMIPEHEEGLNAISSARIAMNWGDRQAVYIISSMSAAATATLSTFALLFVAIAMIWK